MHDTSSSAEYMQDVGTTAGSLAIANATIVEDDLCMFSKASVMNLTISQSLYRVRDNSISFDEVFNKLDFERQLKRSDTTNPSLTLA